MAVPRLSQLQRGIGVNIVLKADQRTGKLTSGRVLDILTRGDHPRGIKVRLTDGQIGRVQSLTPPHGAVGAQSIARNAADPEPESNCRERRGSQHPLAGRGGRNGRGLQDDHRLDRVPQEPLSLFDYVRMPSSNAGVSKSEPPEITTQEQLESEFPKLDSALISAILMDYPEVVEARKTIFRLEPLCDIQRAQYPRASKIANYQHTQYIERELRYTIHKPSWLSIEGIAFRSMPRRRHYFAKRGSNYELLTSLLELRKLELLPKLLLDLDLFISALLEDSPIRRQSEGFHPTPAPQFAAIQERLASYVPLDAAQKRQFVDGSEELGPRGRTFSACPRFNTGVPKARRVGVNMDVFYGRSDVKNCESLLPALC